ncbi:hypothetical protein HanPSC8_Chr06g0236831 [Helianthus annuus]|nr:hypothetical protein HanPSC8_Chr06g0236831 [Helianthus annuus]
MLVKTNKEIGENIVFQIFAQITSVYHRFNSEGLSSFHHTNCFISYFKLRSPW